MMKKLIIFMALLVLPVGLSAGIVNNSGTLGADSISFPFYALDSAGNLVATTSGDSVFIKVFYPSGALAYEDSLAFNGTKITTETQHGISTYSWKEAVATIDGTARDGVYSVQILVHDLTSAALWTPHQFEFQLYQTADFDTWADRLTDSLQGVIDSLQSQNGWVAQEGSLFNGNLNLDNATGTLSDAQIDDITVTAGTVSDKTGYSLSGTQTFNNTGTWTGNVTGSVGSVTADVSLTDLDMGLVGDTTWNIFNNASNEDNFKATGFAIAGDAMTLTAAERGSVEDSVNAQAADYKATGFSTHAAADIWSVITRALTDKANFTLTASEWEKVYYLIDTVNVDSSAIGIWMVNNLSGAAGGLDTLSTVYLARLLASVKDSVWKADTAAYNGVVGSFGLYFTDGLATIGQIADSVWKEDSSGVDASQIGTWMVNNLSGAAGGLDTLSTVFQLRLATLIADTSWLSLLSARDGVAGSFGDSAKSWKGIAGSGATVAQIIDSMFRHPIHVDTSGGDSNFADKTWISSDSANWASLTDVTDTINAIVDSVQAIMDSLIDMSNWLKEIRRFAGSGSNLLQNGNFEDSSFAFWSNDSGTAASVIASFAASPGAYAIQMNSGVSGTYKQVVYLDPGFYMMGFTTVHGADCKTQMIVYDSVGAANLDTLTKYTSGGPQTVDRSRVDFFEVTNEGLHRITIGMYATGVGSITVDNIFVYALDKEGAGTAAGLDSIAVYGAVGQLMDDSQGVFIPSDTLMDGEKLAFMPDDWAAADSAGFQGSGGSGSDTTAILLMMTNNSFAQVGTSQGWDLKYLHIRTTDPNDTAFIAHGSGSGLGGIFRGGSSGGIGLEARGFGTNGYGFSAYSDNSYGAFFGSNADSSFAFYIRGTGGAGGLFVSAEDSVTSAETAKAFYIKSNHSDGLVIWGGTGQNRHAIEIRSPYDPVANTQDAIRILALGLNARGIRVTSDSTYAAEYTGKDTAIYISAAIADIVADILGTIDSARYIPAASGVPSGLILNGGFEYRGGSTLFWTLDSGTAVTITASSGTIGSGSFHANGGGTPGYYSQKVMLDSGMYILSAGISLGVSSSAGIVATDSVSGDTLGQIAVITGGGSVYGYRIVSKKLEVVTEGTAYIKWYLDAGASAGIDDISLDPVTIVSANMAGLSDSSAFQGAAGSLDSGTVQRIVSNESDSLSTAHGSGSWASSSGSGSNNVTYMALDTASSTFIMGVEVTVRTMAGALEAVLTTGSSGDVLFTLTSDSFVVTGYKSQYTWFADTISVSGSVTDSIIGYDQLPTIVAGSSSPLSTVFIVYNRDGTAQPGAILTVRNENVAFDTVNSTVIGPILKRAPTDSIGIASVVVPRSFIFDDSLKGLYDISLQWRGRTIQTWEDFWVGNQDTVRIEISE